MLPRRERFHRRLNAGRAFAVVALSASSIACNARESADSGAARADASRPIVTVTTRALPAVTFGTPSYVGDVGFAGDGRIVWLLGGSGVGDAVWVTDLEKGSSRRLASDGCLNGWQFRDRVAFLTCEHRHVVFVDLEGAIEEEKAILPAGTLSPDGRYLVTDRHPESVVDTRTGRVVRKVERYAAPTQTSVVWTEDSSCFFVRWAAGISTGVEDAEVVCPGSGTHQRMETMCDIRAGVWSPDGRILAGPCEDSVGLWDTRDGGAAIQPFSIPHSHGPFGTETHNAMVTAIAFRPNDDGLTLGFSDGRVLYRASEAIHREPHTETVSALAWSRDGSRLASADDAGTVLLTKANGDVIGRWTVDPPVQKLLFSPRGDVLAGAGKRSLVLFQTAGDRAVTLAGAEVPYTPDGGRQLEVVAYDDRGRVEASDAAFAHAVGATGRAEGLLRDLASQ
jgi:hypothetical protein